MSHKYDKYIVLFGAFLMEMAADSYYITATSKPDIQQFMNSSNSSASNITTRSTIWISNSIVIGIGVALSFGGYLEKKIGSLNAILLGGFFLSINICLMYFTLKTYLSIIILTYGFLGGCGSGIVYGVALGLPIKWFRKNKGLVLGITISGFGLSPAFLNILKKFILFTNNKKDISKLPLFFLIVGLLFASIQGVAVFLISRPIFNQFKQQKNDSNKSLINSNDNLSILSIPKEIQPHHIIFEFDFWILWLIMFLNNSCDTIIMSLFYEYSNCNNNITNFITIFSITGALCNCFGRFILGHLADRFSFKKVMLPMTLSNMVFFGTIPAISALVCSNCCIAFIFWFGIINFSNGGNFSVFPTMFLKLFGKDNFVFNYGMLFTSTSVSRTVFSIIIMNVPNKLYMFITAAVTSLLAALLTLLFRGKSLITYNN